MHISSTFNIRAAPEEVFDRFLDPGTMKRCIPGCHELERLDDSHYRGQLTNQVAHVRFSARFAARIVELERPRLAVARARARARGVLAALLTRLRERLDHWIEALG